MSDIFDFTDAGLNEVHEETVVEAGTEKRLRLININQDVDKNGVPYVMPFFEVTDEPYCKEFGDYLPLPNSEMSERELNKARARLTSFLEAFSLPINFDKGEIQGKEGWAILGIGKDRDDQPVNKINKYVMGH